MVRVYRANVPSPIWEDRSVMATIGLIGAGHIGSQIARLAVANGYDVVISNSRGPESLADLVAELGPKARAATVLDAARAGDIVVVTIPLKNYGTVPAEPLAGKIVIDTNNYYPQRYGQIPELDDESMTTAELLQQHLPNSKVVPHRAPRHKNGTEKRNVAFGLAFHGVFPQRPEKVYRFSPFEWRR